MKLDRVIAVRNNRTVYRDDDRAVKVFMSGYSKSTVFAEALNQSLMEEAGLSVPAVLEVSVIDGKWSIISEYIDGKTLSRHMEESPSKIEEYMDLFVELQIEIHNSPAAKFLKESSIFSSEHEDDEFDNTPQSVCHGDFSAENIIIDECGKAYVLDWANAVRGNATQDAAQSYVKFIREGKNDLAELYLTKFCEKTATDRNHIKKWVSRICLADPTDK